MRQPMCWKIGAVTLLATSLAGLMIADAAAEDDRRWAVAPAATRPVDPKTVQLPAAMDSAVLAGAGRYLLAPIVRLRKVAVVDLEGGRIARYLSVESDDFIVAGGVTKVIVQLRDRQQLQRWNLASGEVEATAALPVDAGPMVMGCASEGPLFVGQSFVDVATLKRQHIAIRHHSGSRDHEPASLAGGFGAFLEDQRGPVEASPDGKVFACGPRLLVLSSDGGIVYGPAGYNGYAEMPAEIHAKYPAARVIGFGTLTLVARQTFNVMVQGSDVRLVPAVQPDYLVALAFTSQPRAGSGGQPTWSEVTLAGLYSLKEDWFPKCVDLPPMPELRRSNRIEVKPAPPKYRNIFMDVDRGQLITIPLDADRVLIRKVDVGTAAKAKGK